MRGDAAAHDLIRPRGLGDALACLAGDPELRPLAGGTDVMVLFAAGRLPWRRLIDLWPLRELATVEATAEHVTLGALVTYTEVQAHALLAAEFPMLGAAAAETGGWAIQNRGTLGGNIANASPAADSPPALLAYGAELELQSARGARWVDYAGFHTGYKKTVLEPDELITRIRLPRRPRRAQLFRKVGPRRAQAISKVSFAGCADEQGVRIAFGGVAPIIVRCPRTEAALAEGDLAAARTLLHAEIAPIDDVRSNARYRRQVSENLLVAFAERLGVGVG
jgi:CO/xanthine dehydrogenase FAD-binding subunit